MSFFTRVNLNIIVVINGKEIRGIARIGGKLWTPHLAASKCITTGHRKSKEIQPYLPGLECDDREGGIGCTQKASTAIVNGRAI